MIRFSIVIPIYNEEESIFPLYSSLRVVMDGLGEPYEIIFVNDGSEDKSIGVLNSIKSESKNLAVVDFKKHGGKSSALQAGFDIAQGHTIITIDGDLQNRPEDIPKLLDKLGEGYDVVCGWRYRRCDHFKRKLASNMANLFRRILFREKIHDVGCSLRVYSRRSIESIKLHGELHRFITAILKKNGFKIGEVPIDHYPRLFGRSKYGIVARLLKSIPDFLSILF